MLDINEFIKALGGLDYIQKTTDEIIKSLRKLIGLNIIKVGDNALKLADINMSTETIDVKIRNFIALKKDSEDNLKRLSKLDNLKTIKTLVEKLEELKNSEDTEEKGKIASDTAHSLLLNITSLNIQENISNWKTTFKDILEGMKKELNLSESTPKQRKINNG